MICNLAQIFLAISLSSAVFAARKAKSADFSSCILITGNPRFCTSYYYLSTILQNYGPKDFSKVLNQQSRQQFQENLAALIWNELLASDKKPFDYANVPAPNIKHSFASSIVDPRTSLSNDPAMDQRVRSPPNVDLSTIQPVTGNSDPSLGFEYPIQRSMIDPRTLSQEQTLSSRNIQNEPSPEMKYSFQTSIVDPRTLPNIVDKTFSPVTVPFLPSVMDSKLPLKLTFERPPVIRHRYSISEQLLDPRTIRPSWRESYFPVTY